MNSEESSALGVGPIGMLISVAVWALLLFLQQILPLPHVRLSPMWRWVISLLFLLDGFGTLIWSTFALTSARQKGALAQTGPYALVRHPMYGAVLWSGTGAVAFAFQSWLVLLGVIPLHIIWGWLVIHEEADLCRRFGTAYAQYTAETGQFLPRLASLKKAAQPPDNSAG
ncbi:MAG: isoprenylcysteine carboxylmethyltransferase family protein [Fidelibacterota bacterium]|nr:MAG: isoprenylcysteine carboxylmethyltransferase family protein [Candidatus Neomarinimicrobiota bacterium]